MTALKLWLISQDHDNDYDTYDSAVVAAPSAEEAVRIHPNANGDQPEAPRWSRAWAPPDKVTAILIGTATDDAKVGVVLASFNAG